MDEYLPVQTAAPEPPESASALLREHAGLAIAAGFGIGLLAGAVVPGRIEGATARRAAALAAGVAEVALALGRRSIEGRVANRIGWLIP